MRIIPVYMLFVFCLGTAMSQEDEAPDLVTDRPDQTESSLVVPPGWVQIETGALFERDTWNWTLSYPTTLVRVGVLDNLELRFTGEYVYHQYEAGDDRFVDQGLGGVSAGAKLQICDEEGWRPAIAFIGHLFAPLGSRHFRPEGFAPDFRFTFAHGLGDVFSLGVNLGGEWDGDGGSGTAIYTATIGAALADDWGAYAEVFGSMRGELPPSHFADAGVTFLPSPNFQLDASFGLPFTEFGPSYYASTGFSWRLPR